MSYAVVPTYDYIFLDKHTSDAFPYFRNIWKNPDEKKIEFLVLARMFDPCLTRHGEFRSQPRMKFYFQTAVLKQFRKYGKVEAMLGLMLE